ncbi:MAG: RluA family pseudouridine synthase, partial [Deltaproteobacteria bacterium]|nr:RluA family pseudouridine synthase [Deltaproteobacteria bacterium]
MIDCPPERFHWLVPCDPAGTIRVDSLINQNLPFLSRRAREELFSKQAVLINGRPVAKGFKASPGDLLEIEVPGPLSPYPVPDQAPRPSVIFEDQTLVIVDKPGLMPTHPLSPFETGTLANILVSHWPQIVGVGNKALEPGLVHRLDKGTSGLLVVALKQAAWEQLKKDLGTRKWEKTYQALIEGVFPEPMTISLPLAHDPSDDRKMNGIRGPGHKRRGRIYQALTQVRPIKRFKEFTLVEIRLITGITHQIRVHLSSHGYPLAGDTLYGSKRSQALGLPLNRF